ncbi:MAG TPA: aconitate hydratase AcnA [Ensifer sp.]|uniref:aconitate hydratase AcnA n=1 Tax=Ensifer sp. TaxID=1872086 RepID=UPI002E14C983|nr:aconitate hydratase AcnA [Ensifer sp.]
MAALADLNVNGVAYTIVDLPKEAGQALWQLPYIHRVLLENVLRTGGGDAAKAKAAILDWLKTRTSEVEIPFLPNRVLMHDTTCGPALVDIAAMRSALAEAGVDPARLNPVVPVDVSTDHSVGVDFFGQAGSLEQNMAREFQRNAERYRFMKWAMNTLNDFTVHPPGTGIMHTLNLERLATIVTGKSVGGVNWAMPDTLIGTDSHTPMINGIGVLAWGVGGLEAESVMFGMPVTLKVPDIVGVKLTGKLNSGVLATDLALTVTEQLRKIDLQDRYVEFFGEGVSSLTAGDRAVVANMTPEFGGNSGYFPIDDQAIRYLEMTGRSTEQRALVEAYAKRVGLWFDPTSAPRYTDVVELDLSTVEASLAGPTRPQDRRPAGATRQAMEPLVGVATGVLRADRPEHGVVAIAAITSCTNTSDPRLVIAAGLLARKARALGLKPAEWVKTSLAPGSPTAERYLSRAGLLEDLEAVGFGIVGYGCTTCIGNSGPLTEPISAAMDERGIVPVAVLSGNRNFPGRVHPRLEAGFLASPPLVVAFALAGTVLIDILNDPIATTFDGKEITLSMLWPSSAEIDEAVANASSADDFKPAYDDAEANDVWAKLDAPTSVVFPWDEHSTYIRRPPFAAFSEGNSLGRYEAHPLIVLGDDITTDHISPAGAIPVGGTAGRYLVERGESPTDLNVFSSRRGNWEAMVRGLFTNKTVRNQLGRAVIPAGSTVHAPSGEVLPLWDAARRYREDGQSVVIFAGERYGMGSSRDWAAKGVSLLGARAVLALSFERIHRTNLIGMGILPLRLPTGFDLDRLALEPGDVIRVSAEEDSLAPRCSVPVSVRKADGHSFALDVTAAIETYAEIRILRAGGILPTVLNLLSNAAPGGGTPSA